MEHSPTIPTGIPHPKELVLHLDLETFSKENLKTSGIHRYATDPSTEILMIQWAVGDGSVRVVDNSTPEALKRAIDWVIRFLKRPDAMLAAWNAAFERAILTHVAGYEHPLTRTWCVMVQSFSHGMPGSLDMACKALPIPEHAAKLSGDKIISMFCKPLPKNQKADRHTHLTRPNEWAEFRRYGERDVIAERAIAEYLPTINVQRADRIAWVIDQYMNTRGVQVNLDLMEAAILRQETSKQDIVAQFRALQDVPENEKLNPTQNAKVKAMLQAKGLDILDMQASTLKRALASQEVSDDVRQLVELFMLSNKKAAAKYVALKKAVSTDGRVRGMFQYAGAARTRRWAGRIVQLQNLLGRGIPSYEEILIVIDKFLAGADVSEHGDVISLLGAAVRATLVSTPGYRIGVADLSNIEGRVIAWMAGETRALEAFEAYDRGEGPDSYVQAVADITGCHIDEVDSKLRNSIGKVYILSGSFGAGVIGIQTFVCNFGIRMQDYWDTLVAGAPEARVRKAYENWDKFGYKQDKPDARIEMGPDEWYKEWVATELLKLTFRDNHPKIVQYWYALESAAREAITNPGTTVPVGPHTYRCVQVKGVWWLFCTLPSGRSICYNEPRIEADGRTISYMNKNQTNQWVRTTGYGGLFAENNTQAVAGDVMRDNLECVVRAGWHPLGLVHDEVIAERRDDEHYDGQTLADALAARPHWAEGLPLAAPAGDTATTPTYTYYKF